MTANTGKILSMSVVGVMVGYCCWPYVFGRGQSPVAPHVEAPPAIAAALLVPDIEPPPDRDPFRAVRPPDTVAQEWTPPAHDEASAESEPNTGTASENDSESNAVASLGPLALNGTFVRGDQRVALINGRVYATGEPLADSGASPSPFVVSEIFPDRVVIEHKGQTTELSYPGLAATSQPSARIDAKGPAYRPAAATTKTQPHKLGSSPPKAPISHPTRGPSRHD